MKRVGADGGSARRIAAGRAQMMQPFQVAALALPVADRVVDKFQLAHAAKIGDRKDRVENRLQPRVFPLVGKQVHLQEPLVRLLLNLDQVRNRNRGLDLGKVHSLGGGAIMLTIHSLLLRTVEPGSVKKQKTMTGRREQCSRSRSDLLAAREGMKRYPKKFGSADWHQRRRSLERKKRNGWRPWNPVLRSRIGKCAQLPCVQFRSHCNQNARIPDSQSPIRGLVRLKLLPRTEVYQILILPVKWVPGAQFKPPRGQQPARPAL